MDVEAALLKMKEAPFEDLGFAKVNHHRTLRQGVAEVIYGAGKTPEQIRGIVSAMLAHGQKTILITRMSAEAAELVGGSFPLQYDELSRVGIAGEPPKLENGVGKIVIATGGTSDMPVAEEAAKTAEYLGHRVVPFAGEPRTDYDRACCCCRGRHGGRFGVGCWRACGLPGHRRSHQRWLWGELWRPVGASLHAQLLRQRSERGEYRQRLRRRLFGKFD